MKKTLAVLVTLALFASAAFAEVTWSGSGRAVVVPYGVRLANDLGGDDDANDVPQATYFGAENPWSGDGPRLGVAVEGKRDEGNMGFKVALNLESFAKGGNPIDDNAANLWIKPFNGAFETLKFTLGMYQIDNLRFNWAGSGSSFHNYVMYNRSDLSDEDAVLARFHGKGFSTHIAYEPIENLWLGAGFGSVGDTRSFAGEFKQDGFGLVLNNVQVGLGYTIPDVGVLRLQYLGEQPDPAGNQIDKPLDKGGDTGAFQGAFNLKALSDINIDLGVSVPFANKRDRSDDELVKQRDIVAAYGLDINTRPFRLWSHGSVKFGGYNESRDATYDDTSGDIKKISDGTNIAIMLTPMYYIANDLILVADLFFDSRTGSDVAAINVAGPDGDPTINRKDFEADKVNNNYFDFGAGLYIRKNISGGDVRAGVTCKLPGGDAHNGASAQIFIPIMFNYNF